ncbi:MAG: class I SAM-dependent methyltransferase [Acidobacteria bacterium]|nr:class I SAM-dependent methyltransferase [Acidobacteriota bacterium]
MDSENAVIDFVRARTSPKLLKAIRGIRYRNRSLKSVFTQLYFEPKRDQEMISGPGSDLVQTAVISREIPALIKELEVQTMLDAPCGDFFWMQRVELKVKTYIGVDVVRELIERHTRNHANANRRFMCRDITRDSLPCVDLVFSRDALVHLSSKDCQSALAKFKASGSQYLLMTTFPDTVENEDILTGEWRPINFQLPPFNLPPPLRLINEHCTEDGGRYSDKSLGLWKLADILNAE